MHYASGMSIREVATAMDTTEETVKSYIKRGGASTAMPASTSAHGPCCAGTPPPRVAHARLEPVGPLRRWNSSSRSATGSSSAPPASTASASRSCRCVCLSLPGAVDFVPYLLCLPLYVGIAVLPGAAGQPAARSCGCSPILVAGIARGALVTIVERRRPEPGRGLGDHAADRGHPSHRRRSRSRRMACGAVVLLGVASPSSPSRPPCCSRRTRRRCTPSRC